MSDITDLAHRAVNGADELSVQLIQPDGLPAVVRINWPRRPTTAAAAHYPAVAAAIVKIIAERVQRRWHDTRREDYEQRHESVPTVRGRSPRSRGVRTVAVVGGAGRADMAGLNVSPVTASIERLPRKRADSMIEKILKTVAMALAGMTVLVVGLVVLGFMLLVPYD